MSEFDETQPAVLHEQLNDEMIAWTGELQANWRKYARKHADGIVTWDGGLFDGWAEALGG